VCPRRAALITVKCASVALKIIHVAMPSPGGSYWYFLTISYIIIKNEVGRNKYELTYDCDKVRVIM